jgi:hypothetical protein
MEKAGFETRQVWCMETSVSEPLMTYRNEHDDVETGGASYFRDKSGSYPISGPGGIRYLGGVTMHRALVRNMGTCRRDAKGERGVSRPRDAESTDARHRGGAVRSSGDGS